MTDHEGEPHCPKEGKQPGDPGRPLHEMPPPDTRLVCRRCGTRYDRNDPRIVWVAPQRAQPRSLVGGNPVGGIKLGDERQARLDRRARLMGQSRAELVRRAVDFYLRHLDTLDQQRKGKR